MAFMSYDASIAALYESMIMPKNTERVFIGEALGRVNAHDIVADHHSPALPTSAMDGYAIRHEDQTTGRIRILGDLPAGTYEGNTISKGECVKTFTGSLMTEGADTLIPIENVEVEGEYIVIKKAVPKGFSVRAVGENFALGEVIIPKNRVIDFAEIGVLASMNLSQIDVYAKPKVAIIATGSEILDVGEKETNPAQIRSSNQFTLEALAKKAGANVTRMGLVKDQKAAIEAAILEALALHDIVVTTGGVSVGDYDFVKEIVAGLSPHYITTGVNIKPGQHIKIAQVGKKYIFALPGFPYSSTVTFMLYVIPMIYQMQGRSPRLPIIKAVLDEAYRKKSNKTEFAAANLRLINGVYHVDFAGKREGSSAILTNMLGAVGIVCLSETVNEIHAGDMVDVIDVKAL